MSDDLSRRDWLKAVGAAGAGSLLPPTPLTSLAQAPQGGAQAGPRILPLTSTSDVFVPARGRSYQKFSFDFPEPSIEIGGWRFGFLVFTRENAYGLRQEAITVDTGDETTTLRCAGLVWAGGQEHAEGRLTARFTMRNGVVEWDANAEMRQPIKAVTTIIRGVPRGRVSVAGNAWFDPGDDELLFGYPFGGGDLFGGNTAGSMTTPLLVVEPSGQGAAPGEGSQRGVTLLSSLDDHVRTKRFYLQPGPDMYRVEAVFEAEGWRDQTALTIPRWRIGQAMTLGEAVDRHYAHLERAFRIPRWDARDDVPAWLRRTALVITLHGMHYTGYVFNDYARMLEILRWVANRIPVDRVLVFLSAWDGRYYWDYPVYRAAERMGGEAGLGRLIGEGRRLGFRFMPMFGANAANRRQPAFDGIANAATARIDGDPFDITWVDWDNDRHQEGWLGYMNLGVDAWREWLTARIADAIERYDVDAYFLDIAGGWINNPRADMHEGMRRLVAELRARYPHVAACGEMHYDALLEFIPFYQVYAAHATPYARFFSHLSHPAPGRGSTGVHEAGFGRWNPETLSLPEGPIPTLNVVDDTFGSHQTAMAAVIAEAARRAGIRS